MRISCADGSRRSSANADCGVIDEAGGAGENVIDAVGEKASDRGIDTA